MTHIDQERHREPGKATIHSKVGSLVVHVWHDEDEDLFLFRVSQTPNQGEGIDEDIAGGVLGEFTHEPDAEAITCSTEKIRVAADRLAQAYNFATQVNDEGIPQ